MSPVSPQRFKRNFYGFSLKPFHRIVIQAPERYFQVIQVKLPILWPNYRPFALPSSATKLLASSAFRVRLTKPLFFVDAMYFFRGTSLGTSEHGHADSQRSINRETSKMGGVGSADESKKNIKVGPGKQLEKEFVNQTTRKKELCWIKTYGNQKHETAGRDFTLAFTFQLLQWDLDCDSKCWESNIKANRTNLRNMTLSLNLCLLFAT